MNAFGEGQSIEHVGLNLVTNWLASTDAQVIPVSFTAGLGQILQRGYGVDLIVYRDDRLEGWEVKTEEANKHQKLFLETWSNQRLGAKGLGWLAKSRADVLAYYFIREQELYVLPFKALRDWTYNNWFHWEEKHQRKREQANDTRGFCVPIVQILQSVPGSRLVNHADIAPCLSHHEAA